MTSIEPRRLAVLSDIHGNLHALEAVLRSIDSLRPEAIVCLGDVIGYGAFPNECIQLLADRSIPTIAGNHDHAAIGRTDISSFNELARQALEWTRGRLTAENVHWLGRQPYQMALGEFFFVHATPEFPQEWGYVQSFGAARAAFESFREPFCFIGHSHQPLLVQLENDEMSCPDNLLQPIPIRDDVRYLINVGSVGQPRDRNPAACFVLVDLDEKLIAYHRVPYDVLSAQQAIRQAGLPEELYVRLGYGW